MGGDIVGVAEKKFASSWAEQPSGWPGALLAGKCDICLLRFTGFVPKEQEPEAVVSAVHDSVS